ncbi:MAG: hypothetical protein JRI93_00255 [Deltaproteobacteria bacterium]|nr:hypothetical protein [Deltaproteobacteria bacterium]
MAILLESGAGVSLARPPRGTASNLGGVTQEKRIAPTLAGPNKCLQITVDILCTHLKQTDTFPANINIKQDHAALCAVAHIFFVNIYTPIHMLFQRGFLWEKTA